jgi:predicted metal-binding membrane protein
MKSASSASLFAGTRIWLWERPESWVLGISACAWIYLIANGILGVAHPSAGAHGSHGRDTWSVCLEWSVMIAAMMFPQLAGQLRTVAARSFWERRHRAMALFLFGHLSLWLIYGLAVEVSLRLWPIEVFGTSSNMVPILFAIAALWELSPQKRRSIVSCHWTMPLAPSGWRANLDCFRYGLRIGASCCTSCWILMLVCAATGHALWVLLIATFVSWSERFLRQRPLALCSFMLLGVAVLLAISNK